MTIVTSTSPRTGRRRNTPLTESRSADVRAAAVRAAAVSPLLDEVGRHARAALLDQIAAGLDAARGEIVAVADEETALGVGRLNGELTRTVYQFRLFAEAVREGGYVEATIDPAADTGMGPRPDLRRMLVPIGPVAVFGASNFPLAFSVPGGDTAAALAAGCAVVVKAHGAHPLTSDVCARVIREALESQGLPANLLQVVYGLQAGIDLVSDPRIRAVSFTGSLRGGKALLDVIGRRDEPIPFYGELSGVNPLIVTSDAARERAEEIADGFVASFTLGAGQFCTKPGLVFVPDGDDGDRLVARAVQRVESTEVSHLLTEGIAGAYAESTRELPDAGDVEVLARGAADPVDAGFTARAQLFGVRADKLTPEMVEERFGPTSVIVRYGSRDELEAGLGQLSSSLTTTIHAGDGETDLPRWIEARMRESTGRFVYDGFPTGVSVAWAQHHGGPWPSTNSLHTSVGVSALRRFLRPMAWQSFPQGLLPEELRDDSNVPRRVDGELVLPVTGRVPGGLPVS